MYEKFLCQMLPWDHISIHTLHFKTHTEYKHHHSLIVSGPKFWLWFSTGNLQIPETWLTTIKHFWETGRLVAPRINIQTHQDKPVGTAQTS